MSEKVPKLLVNLVHLKSLLKVDSCLIPTHFSQDLGIDLASFWRLIPSQDGNLAKNCFFCHFGTFAPMHWFQNSFGQMPSFWALWKSLFSTYCQKRVVGFIQARPCRHKMAVSEQGRRYFFFFFAWNVFIWVQTLKKMQSQLCSILLGLLKSTSHMC